MKNILKIISRVVLLGFLPISVPAAVRSSVISGNWSNAATWGGVLPAAGDEVIISAGTVVNLNQSTPNAINGLTLAAGAVLKLTVNGSGLHINGVLNNEGELTLWNSDSQKATLFLEGNSSWRGRGTWNLGMISLSAYSLEFEEGLVIRIADNISGNTGSSLNRINRCSTTQFVFNGTENASVPSSSSAYFYPCIRVNKTAGIVKTLSFNDQGSDNQLNVAGSIVLSGSNDRLAIGSGNILTLNYRVNGDGTLSGGANSSLVIAGDAGLEDTLKMTNGTSFYDVTIVRRGALVCQNSFTVRNKLAIIEGSRFILPSNASLTLGVNGSAPTAGILDCRGALVAGIQSSLNIRGNSTRPLNLELDQAELAGYSLAGLQLSRMRNAGEVKLTPASSLIVNSSLEIDTANVLNLNGGALYLNQTITIRPEGYFTGSDQSTLYIGGNGGNATLRFNPHGDMSNRTLKSFQLDRSPGRIITLADRLSIRQSVNLLSGKLNSNGNLVLLSDAAGSASLSPLTDAADLMGDVTVQSWFTGGPGMRGTRMLSSPVDDSGTANGVFRQLQDVVIITGPGGSLNGFDTGGNAQPYAATIQFYKEAATPQQSSFTVLPDIFQRAAGTAYPGRGKGFFLFYRGNRENASARLNPVNGGYAVAEDVTVSYSGPVNKRDLTVALSFTGNPGDAYNGYNVLGNPYPATIDWLKVEKVSVTDAVSIIKPGGGMCTYSNGIVVNGTGLPLIQAGQAFYARASAPGATVKFMENCKSSAALPARFLRTAETADHTVQKTETEVLRILLTDSNASEETAVVMKEGSAVGVDEWDALYFTTTATVLSTQTEQGSYLAINFLPFPQDSLIVPLRCISTGQSTLTFTQVPAAGYYYTLTDSKLQRTLPLSSGSSYSFMASQPDPTNQDSQCFQLVIRRKATFNQLKEVSSFQIYPVPVKDRINIDPGKIREEHPRLTIYSITGKKVLETIGLQGDLSLLSAGTYTAELTTFSGRLLGRKKFIKE